MPRAVDVVWACVVAAVLDRDSGELWVRRLPGNSEQVAAFASELAAPVRATYEAGPTGYVLAVEADRVQVLFVSVDPERDTPDALAKYVGAFDPRFIALRGDLPATQRVAKEFKIYFEKRKQGDTYTVDHSAQSYVIDPQGRLRLLVRQDRLANDLPDDLRIILKQG